MDVELLAFDSMGVRSMCTFIDTGDLRVMIDPGVSLAPRRFGLPPHRLELERLEEFARAITEKAMISDVIIITHYHYDHHDLGDIIPLEIYDKKFVLIKDPKNNINRSQCDFRAPLFLGIIKEKAQRVEVADAKSFQIGKTKIEFSKAVFHGSSSLLGYVVEVMVEADGDRIIHTSDVQGPISNDQMEFLLNKKPRLVIADGPMIYMLGYRYSYENLESSMRNLGRLVEGGVEELVVDHHFLRDTNYYQYIKNLEDKHPDAKICTAAEYMGKEVELLEARRRELYGAESSGTKQNLRTSDLINRSQVNEE
ncbi:MAG: MBL fold metallo-hydrolase [Candidatus Methanomethyliaceae archaeon]|nr:MBL fold metallo-hydrolase [Candidatus Methanomethyliaceae archaeon]